jgi:predicted ATPase
MTVTDPDRAVRHDRRRAARGQPYAAAATAVADRVIAYLSLQRYAARRPLLIVIDDAHWMDELSALALDQLVPALAVSPVRWLLTVNTTRSDPPRCWRG